MTSHGFAQNHPNSKKSKNPHLTCFTSSTLVGGSGFFQSFLLIRELIRERRPQPVNTPEPMEPIEPTEGEVPSAGGVWGEELHFFENGNRLFENSGKRSDSF